MKEVNRNRLYMYSAVVILFSSVFYFLKIQYAEYLFAAGAAGYALAHLVYRYPGSDARVKRLHRMNKISSVLMIAASTLMLKQRNEWILCLTIAAFLHLYVAFVLPNCEEKQ